MKRAAQNAQAQGIRLKVVKLLEAKKGFVLLPHRWVVKRSFGSAERFKRLSRNFERLASTLTGTHWHAMARLYFPLFSSVFKSIMI